ncbi:MAG: hypothetical protein KBS73_00255 [Bacteroidales bacterium]|nr:hypothetical protein [Candidatus Cacconaster equifaecalis]
MYVKNQNFAIYLILAVVVGFGLSFLFGGLSVRSDLLGGDVSKANRYYNQKEDPSFTVIEERLRNDGEFLDRTKGAMGFLQSRMTVLSELTEKTIEACAGIPEFQPLMAELQSMNAKAFNTAKALSNANDGLDKMVAGRYAPEYELYSNQAYIGFSKVESQMDLGEKFCRIATSFLEGKDEGQYQQIAQLLSVWEVYCIENSQMVADWHSPDIDSRDTVLHEQMQEGNRHKINIPGPGPRTGGGSGKLSNRVLDEYINGISTGVRNNIDWAGLGGITLVDAFPTINVYPGMTGFPNASQVESQTLKVIIEDI